MAVLTSCSARDFSEAPLPYRQAEDSFRLGDYDRAIHGYRIFLDSGESRELVPRAYYRLASAEYRRGRYKQSLAVLDEMERRLPDREFRQVYELRGDAEYAQGNNMSAVHWWEIASEGARIDARLALRQRISGALARMDRKGLMNARAVLSTEEALALVDARLRQPEGSLPRQPGANRVRDPGALPGSALSSARGPTLRIACMLPLTGPYATYGRRSLNGIRLALGAHAGQLVVRDTQGEAGLARAELDELAADPSIVAVIGPLRSKVAEVIAPRAERSELPMVVLSQQQGISGRYVLQPAMTYEGQAAELAEYAVGILGLRRFGILHPRDPYGSGLATAFREQVERRGGKVVGILAYSPGADGFSIEVLSIQKWIDDEGLQAVFIPDSAVTATALGRQLRRSRPDVILLGSNAWHDPGQLGPAAAELDGAVFVDGFFIGSRRQATQDFVAAYEEAYRSVPQIFEAQAYDAANLVLRALEAGARTRARLVPAMRRFRTLEGAAGTLGIGPRGVQRQLFLLRLSDGTITEIAPGRSPSSAPSAGF